MDNFSPKQITRQLRQYRDETFIEISKVFALARNKSKTGNTSIPWKTFKAHYLLFNELAEDLSDYIIN